MFGNGCDMPEQSTISVFKSPKITLSFTILKKLIYFYNKNMLLFFLKDLDQCVFHDFLFMAVLGMLAVMGTIFERHDGKRHGKTMFHFYQETLVLSYMCFLVYGNLSSG